MASTVHLSQNTNPSSAPNEFITANGLLSPDSCYCHMVGSVDTQIELLMTIGTGKYCCRPKYSSPLPRCCGFYKTVGFLAPRPPLILFGFSLERSATYAVRTPLHIRVTLTGHCTEHTRDK